MTSALVKATNEEAIFEEQFDVVDLYSKGYSETQISRELRIRRVDVLRHLDNFRSGSIGNAIFNDRLDELIAMMDREYTLVSRELWNVVELLKNSPETPQYIGQRTKALSEITNATQKRIDMMQKLGVSAAADMTAEVEDMQEKVDTLMNILRDELCESCKRKVWDRLEKTTNKVEPVVIYGQ